MVTFLNYLILFLFAVTVAPFIFLLAFFLLLLDFLRLLPRPREQFNQNQKKFYKAFETGSRSEGRETADNRILILQSADPQFVLHALDRLYGMPRFRDSHCTIFCRNRSEVLKHFVGHALLDQVIAHSELQGWWKYLVYFRRQRFDAVVVFFTGDPSYWKMKCFSFLLGARHNLIFNETHHCTVLSWRAHFALFERDLLLSGIFHSDVWKMNRFLRWLADKYRVGQIQRLFPHSGKTFRQTYPSLAVGKRSIRPGSAKTTPYDWLSSQSELIQQPGLSDAKHILTALSKLALQSLLSSKVRLCLPACKDPEVSVIMVLYNRAELTLRCLRSLMENDYKSLEIIIVDNASLDTTTSLLDRIDGAVILRNPENFHFLKGANQGAQKARGRYLLFLNNDTQVLPGSIKAAVKTIERSDNIGAVGGKLMLPDGKMQEAGSIVWRDGSCHGYGRGDDPFSPQYMFRRDVDYCSGAFLLTRRGIFEQMGGFDEVYQPFYYEETDFCLRLWEHGLRTVYEPEAAVIHYEFASSPSSEAAIGYQAEHRELFRRRHRERLQNHCDPGEENEMIARSSSRRQYRILFIDDRVPHPALGSGFPRANTILTALANMGNLVTFYPMIASDEEWSDVYVDIPREVEVMLGWGSVRLYQFLAARIGYYDSIFISRPHNMQHLHPILQAHEDWFRRTKIIYDAEALFTRRDVGYKKLLGKKLSDRNVEQLIKSEIELAAAADLVVSVSKSESDAFAQRGIKQVCVLGHSITVAPTPRFFRDRKGLLFVGTILEESSPNGDAVLWFIKEILPVITDKLGCVPLTIAGTNRLNIQEEVRDHQIRILGKIDDLSAIYDEARIFVAPTRFAAGIPHKIHEAAARGVPVITTSLLADQLGWRDDVHLLVADDPQSFADRCVRLYDDAACWERIRRSALDQVQRECSPESFRATLESIFDKD